MAQILAIHVRLSYQTCFGTWDAGRHYVIKTLNGTSVDSLALFALLLFSMRRMCLRWSLVQRMGDRWSRHEPNSQTAAKPTLEQLEPSQVAQYEK